MKTLIFDLESDGFLNQCTRVWVLIAQDVHTGTVYTFTDHDEKYPSIEEGLAFLQQADALAGHNVVEFDLRVLKKLYDWEFHGKVFDTWIISELTNYKRQHRHGIAGWGEHLGYQKINFDNFSEYSDDMRVYCERDVLLNTKVYQCLLAEVAERKEVTDKFATGLKVEHDVAHFNSIASEDGWLFDHKSANELLKELYMNMEAIEKEIEPQLGTITRYIDKEPKTPKYTKAGQYTATTARMLGELWDREVRPTEALLDPPPIQPGEEFQRSVTEEATLGNMESVKQFLTEQGWKPDDWNVKMFNGQWIRQSPKLTTTSLEKLGNIGLKIDRYYSLRARRSVLEGWIDHATADGHLHGKVWSRGTPVFRARHEIVANLPSVKAEYGPDMRNLLIAEPGRKLVGADSSANHIRGLCHYLKDDDFTREVIDGDMHQRNADVLGCDRNTAKTFFFAYLYGAGDGKLGKTLTGKASIQKGREARNKFQSSIPGLAQLVNKAKNMVNNKGYIPGLDGRKVYTPKDYQALNYLLQSCEAITCKASISWGMAKFKEEGIDAQPRAWFHDEYVVSVPEEHAKRAAEIMAESFREGPKLFGVTCMDGEAKIGETYYETH